MKIPPLVVLAFSFGFLAGCGKSDTTASAAAAPGGPKVFELSANDTMKYNLTRLEVGAGEEVTLTLTNAGSMPKQSMAHNFCLLKKDVDATAFDNAALSHQAGDYFPMELADEVIAHTRLLGPRQSDTITFKAPTEPGEYTYLCTFPAHFIAGMHGVLVVR